MFTVIFAHKLEMGNFIRRTVIAPNAVSSIAEAWRALEQSCEDASEYAVLRVERAENNSTKVLAFVAR